MRRTLSRAEAIIVSDRALLDETPLLREFADKCHVVPFGIDVSKYERPVPRHPDLKVGHDRGRLVLACGRLVPYKGFDVLIRAAVGQTFEVWIVGEGRERATARTADPRASASPIAFACSAPFPMANWSN